MILQFADFLSIYFSRRALYTFDETLILSNEMKFAINQKFIALFFLVIFGLFASACQKQAAKIEPKDTPTSSAQSPTEAYKLLYAAVKSKNTDAIKSVMSKQTIAFGQMVSQRNNTPLEKVYENGFLASTFAESLPEIRDERIKGDMGAVEVWDAKEQRFQDVAFINENGGWKLAVGDQFGGTYQSPGKGLAQIELESSNSMGNSLVPLAPNINGGFTSNKAETNSAAKDKSPKAEKR